MGGLNSRTKKKKKKKGWRLFLDRNFWRFVVHVCVYIIYTTSWPHCSQSFSPTFSGFRIYLEILSLAWSDLMKKSSSSNWYKTREQIKIIVWTVYLVIFAISFVLHFRIDIRYSFVHGKTCISACRWPARYPQNFAISNGETISLINGVSHVMHAHIVVKRHCVHMDNH